MDNRLVATILGVLGVDDDDDDDDEKARCWCMDWAHCMAVMSFCCCSREAFNELSSWLI